MCCSTLSAVASLSSPCQSLTQVCVCVRACVCLCVCLCVCVCDCVTQFWGCQAALAQLRICHVLTHARNHLRSYPPSLINRRQQLLLALFSQHVQSAVIICMPNLERPGCADCAGNGHGWWVASGFRATS